MPTSSSPPPPPPPDPPRPLLLRAGAPRWALLAAYLALGLLACGARSKNTLPPREAPAPVESARQGAAGAGEGGGAPVAQGASSGPSSPPGWELAAPAGWCPGGERILTNKGAYCGHRTPLSWQEARARCQEEGGALARLETAEEQEALRAKLASRQGIRGDFWLGLRRDERDTWRWVDGAPLTSAFWTTGEPNNWGGDEPCAHVYASSGLWNDATCEAKLAFLCSLPKRQVTAPGGFRPFRCPGKLLQGRSGAFCYHEELATWGEARNACAQAGGDLATFAEGTDFEALVGGERALLLVGRFWIDLTDRAQEGQWLWGEKTPVVAPDWHPGEPNNAGAQEHCGELLIDHWNDVPCDTRQGWLCEAP